MTDGSSQGLFVVVAVVIFGIFVAISYSLFRDQLTPSLASIFSDTIENNEKQLIYNGRLIRKTPKPYHKEAYRLDDNTIKIVVYGVPKTEGMTLLFPTWTSHTEGAIDGKYTPEDQDDIQPGWSTNPEAMGKYIGKDTWEYVFTRSQHKDEFGIYNTHVYRVIDGVRTNLGGIYYEFTRY